MTAAPRLEMAGIAKSFGPTRALDSVDLRAAAGEVHALIGENGAGKSTLMKVLSGAHRADAGTMMLDGAAYAPAGPTEARRAGVAMVYQELTLAGHLSVEDNLLLGVEPARFGLLDRREVRRRAQAALSLLGRPDIRPDAPVRDLAIGAQQLVEIARALVGEARVIVMDEPTSSLTAADAAHLFEVIGRLKTRGVTVVYISHFLEEVRTVADRFTVLRDGRTVGAGAVADTPTPRIIEMMVGRALDEMFPQVPHTPGEPVLELAGLVGEPLPRGVDLSLRRGEILGLAGLVGSGRTETLRALFGLDPVRAGTVRIATLDAGRAGPADRLARGVGLLSENRKEEGLALGLTVADNLAMSRYGPCTRFGLLSPSRLRRLAGEWIGRLRVRCRSPGQTVRELSGGNQQKVALARLLHHGCDVLLLDEPTRGIDVGSKAEIYRLIGELAAAGKAVLMVSSYLPELMGVCDRIAVMHRGRISRPRPTGEWSEQLIMAYAATGRDDTLQSVN